MQLVQIKELNQAAIQSWVFKLFIAPFQFNAVMPKLQT